MKTGSDPALENIATPGQVDLAIVDDDPDFRNYLEDALRDDNKYAVRAYATPGDLYAACEQRLPDIVLLDMKMGGATGEEVIERLLSRWPDCASSSLPVTLRLKACAPRSSCASSIIWRSHSLCRSFVRFSRMRCGSLVLGKLHKIACASG